MSKEDCIEAEGVVIEVLPNTNFRVRLKNNHEIVAYLSGKHRKKYIKIPEGDHGKVELSPYERTKGRVVCRNKK